MTRARRLLTNCRGNVTVVFALVAVPLLLSVGAALDYERVARTRSNVQAALDAAVLSSAARMSLDANAARLYFLKNSPPAADLQIRSVDFSSEPGGLILGTATVSIPSGLMSLAGWRSQQITVTSKARGVLPMKVKDVTFQISSAQGAYDKEIYFYTKDKDGKIKTETLVLSYDYTLSQNNAESKVMTPPSNQTVTVSVGDYGSVGQKMVVYEDQSYRGKKLHPKIYTSDDANAADFTRTAGKCTDPGGQTQNWEDGGDSNFKDFVFILKCTETVSGTKSVRLVK